MSTPSTPVGVPRCAGHRATPPPSHLSAEILERAPQLIALYPEPRSALIPLCHLAQEQDGWLTPEAMVDIAGLVGCHPDRGARHRHLLRHAAHRAGRHLPGGGVHQHRLPARRAPPSCWSTPSGSLGVNAGGTTADGDHHPRGGRVPRRL